AWLGPRLMNGFSAEPDPNQRRALIARARQPGSIPPDVLEVLRQAIAHEQISWHEGDIEALDARGANLSIRLATEVVEVQRVLLATGFRSKRPGGELVDRLVLDASLPRAPCGYPIVDAALRWHPRIFVSGALAELELGPVSRNIAGARRAAERLVEAIRSSGSSARRIAS
ncbi:MAG: hypothetical protein AAGF12_08020, partial [Myxococcota bacterium]